MQEQTLSVSDYLAILKRRKWQLIIPAILTFIAATAAAVFLPTRYESTATILIEQQEIPMDLVRSTITTYAEQRVQIINQRVMTTENLSPIIERHDLYAALRDKLGMASAVEKIREDIEVETISAGARGEAIAFTVSYESESPTVAQGVTNDVVSLFLNENALDRRRATQEISRFLDQESRRLAGEVSTLEEKLARFKEQHGDTIPEMMQVNRQLFQRTEDSLRQTDQDIQTLEVNQVYLQSELAKLSPYVATGPGSDGRVLSPSERLKELEAERLRLSSRYSATHPDRVAVEREIETLRREIGRGGIDDGLRPRNARLRELATLSSRYSSEHPEVKALQRQANASAGSSSSSAGSGDADNPLYIQLQSQVAANQSKLDALRESRQELESRLAELESRLAEGPKIEREYLLITRDYDAAVEKYNQVKSKHMEAVLAESLEKESKGERFTLIEPPLVPDQPSSPDRPKIFLIGLVAAGGAGLGTVAGLETLDGRIYALRTISNAVGAPPLAVIPFIESPAHRRRRLIKRIVLIVALIALIAGSAFAIQYFWMPLDAVWLWLLERLGFAHIIAG